mmetsp:Transcript_14692/g.35843  ORF Transcript_14692/g.35843 Transcript_14692/m.35843 type:complete len:1892 (-) Transcript_14692:135-5810(-)
MSNYSSSVNGRGGGTNSSSNGTSSSTHATTDYERGAYWDDDFRPLRDAGKFILDALRQDESSPNADLYVRINSSSTAPTWSESSRVAISSSSLDQQESNPSHRYFSAESSSGSNGNNNNNNNDMYRTDVGEAAVVRHRETLPLPGHLREMMSRVRTQMLMGLFPQAGLAWMALDDTVYLWSYRSTGTTYGPDGRPVAGAQFLKFTVPSTGGNRPIIVSVGLAPPKPGVFRESVDWCLIITTKDEARVYCITQRTGVDISGNTVTLGAGWVIVGTGFAVPTDFHSFYSVASTASGRVFLGGSDGNLYELDYDLLIKDHQQRHAGRNGEMITTIFGAGAINGGSSNPTIQRQLEDFYDGNDGLGGTPPCPPVLVESSFSSASAGIKRVLNAALSSSHGDGGEGRARKCRKLNHTQSSFFHRILPDVVADGANAIFGSSTMKEGGPIKQIVVDEERQLLYTLSSRGWICVLDMAVKGDNADNDGQSQLSVSAVLDAPSTARNYLESVAQGRTTPLRAQTHKDSLGELRFLGDGEAAARGVGGMDKARKILKLAEPGRSRRGDRGDPSILAPVSIQVVPTQESSRITLVATTSGGLRYYLSALKPPIISSVPLNPPYGIARHQHPWSPHHKFTMLYIRGPPQISSTTLPFAGEEPDILQNWKVDSACYSGGKFIVAFTPTKQSTSSGASGQNSLDIVMAATPDQSVKDIQQMMSSENGGRQKTTQISPGGLCELVSFPIPSSLSVQSNGNTSPARLPGGRVYDIEPTSAGDHAIIGMTVHSKTPTDSALAVGLVPAFFPPKESQKPKTSQSKSTTLATTSNSLISSTSLTILYNIFTNKPIRQGLDIRQSTAPSNKRLPTYRMSRRCGVEGFSLSAADVKASSSSGVSRSVRLNPWLLTPAAAPLDPMALQHLDASSPTTVFALNPGGVHSFQSVTLLEQLSGIIASAGSHIEHSKDLYSFFLKHGAKETCAMCLLVAVRYDTSEEMQKFAMKAALHFGDRPQLLRVDPTDTRTQISSTLRDDPWMPPDYSLKISNLCAAAFSVVSRLLRPIWFKPAVVVTEGRVVKQASKTVTTPAKVELLLDESSLEQIRKPLLAFQSRIMCYLFKRAVATVPLKRKGDSTDDADDRMDIDGAENLLIASMQYQYEGRFRGPKSSFLSAEEAQKLAMHMEERNLNSLFRLVSRSTQLLSLLAKLRMAHSMPELPEVNWGLLHGIMVSQLVETSAGQERVENLLNELVTASSQSATHVSASAFSTADCDGLATALSTECPFYFSPGTRFSYNGFRAAENALKLHPGETRRLAAERDAVENFSLAAENWHSADLITGRLLHTADSEKQYVAIAQKAMDYNSPLAKACYLLSKLGSDYALESLVDICLVTSENFRPRTTTTSSVTALAIDRVETRFEWEKDLYHKHANFPVGTSDSSTTSKTAALGTKVTSEDAIDTCQSIIFSYMTQLLASAPASEEHRKGIVMVGRCAGSDDKKFLSSFFTHMLNNGQQETLFEVQSRDLEDWLLRKHDYNMILRFYKKQGKNLEAGKMALNVATDSTVAMTLDKRIEFLAEAEISLDSARHDKEMKVRAEADQLLEQAKSKLRLAELQKRTVSEIGSTQFEIAQDAIDKLKSVLISVDELFNDYSEPYELYEVSLMIVHTSNLNNTIVIEQLWVNVLTQSIVPCATRFEREVFDPLSAFVLRSTMAMADITFVEPGQASPLPLFEDVNAEWIRQVQDAVIGIGQKIIHHGSEFVFPAPFITECLENIRQIYSHCPHTSTKLTPEWTFSILLEVDIPFKRALDCIFDCMKRERMSSDLDVATTIGMLELVVHKYGDDDGRRISGDFGIPGQVPLAAVADGLRPYIHKARLELQQRQSSTFDEDGSVTSLSSRLDMVEEHLGVRF